MLFISLLAIGAVLLAVLTIAGLLVTLSIAGRTRQYFFPALMYLLVGASTGTVVLSERVLRTGLQGLEVISEADMAGGLIAKLLLLVVIAVSVSVCVDWLASRSVMSHARRHTQSERQAFDIFAAFLFFFFAFSVVPIVFGAKFYFHVSLVYPFFIFLALFIAFGYSRISPLIIAKRCLLVIVVGSLVSALIAPGLAIQPGYSSIIPGFNIRLWGITAHPNTLGSVASIALLLELAEPTSRKWLHRLALLSCGTALALSQSKTSISSALIGLIVLFGWKANTALSSIARTGSDTMNRSRLVMASVVASLVLCGVIALFSDLSLASALERRLNLRALGDVSSATGRTWIWSVAVQAGIDSPLFGQGGDFWSAATRVQYGLSGASHAHNLFLQVFSRSGGFGLVGLLVFLFYFARYAIRATETTRGGSLAFLVLFLVRAMFEVPLQPNSVLGAEFFATVAVFFYFVEKGALPQKQNEQAPSDQNTCFPLLSQRNRFHYRRQ